MTTRDGDTLTYDVENHLTSVTKAGVTTSFVYNGDGTRVKREVMGVGTTYYIGNYFEVWVPNSGTTTFNKFYYFGAQRVAARIASTLFYFQGDHLGSSSVAMTVSGTSFYSRQTYFPYGAPRTTEGSALPTDYTFTGQKSDDSTGLMFYGARYYDTTLRRFTQPDTIVPSPLNPQSLNRFSYVLNNPVKYTDPTGHAETCEESCGQEGTGNPSEEEDKDTACAENDTDCDGVADDEQMDTPADTGNEQGTEQGEKSRQEKEKELATSLNRIALVLDIGGAILDTGASLGVVLATTGTGGVGFLEAEGAMQPVLKLTGLIGITSTALTATADFLEGESRIDLSKGISGIEIGADTQNSAINAAIGLLDPEIITNTAVAWHQVLGNDLHALPTSTQIGAWLVDHPAPSGWPDFFP